MPPLLRFLLRRLVAIPVTLLLMTAVLYGIGMLAPPELRAMLYITKTEQLKGNIFELVERAIDRYGLNDPYPVQYARWLANVMRGDLGYSPFVREDVVEALAKRSATTAELTLYSALAFVPLGLLSGAAAGWRRGRRSDHAFQGAAFAATAIPPFVLGLVLLTVFYAGLRWLPPERLGVEATQVVRAAGFTSFTGLLTIDGLLNGRLDVTLDALRHLVLPVLTLSVAHWATLGRITRAGIIEQLRQEYIVAAHARGLLPRSILWGHAFRNTLGPALTSTALSAATLLSGVYVVEVVFSLHGVSELVTALGTLPIGYATSIPDVAAMMGFAVYSVVAVQVVMLALDLTHALLDSRIRQGITDS